jgi:hypothetical protein
MMRMRISALVALHFAAILCSSYADNVEVTVVDENTREPVAGADVAISFTRPVNSDGHHGETDKAGNFGARGTNTMGVFIRINKKGYYEWVKRRGIRKGDHSVTVVLRKVENPIPLYVRDVFLKFPIFDEWLGFDFEVGDWVAPQGRGKSRDILFKFHREYMGNDYTERELEKLIPRVQEAKKKRGEKWNAEEFRLKTAKWDGVLWMDFPSELAGIVEEKGGYLPNSKMKMPHLAPEDGYQTEEIEIKKKSYKSEKEKAEEIQQYIKFGEGKPSGYFIRTRVVEVDGKVVKANYAKLADKIGVGAGGSINFTYYFNPTPNDRNLEYRPGSNLASEQKREYEP